MPPPVPTPTNYPPTPVVHIRTICNGTCAAAGSNNRKTAVVFHWMRVVTAPAVLKTQINAAFQTNIVVPLAAALNVRWSQRNNTVQYLNNYLDQPTKFSGAGVGAIAGDSMPTTCSAYIELLSGFKYGYNRGSKKLFPISESDSTVATDDLLNAGAIARFVTLANAIIAGFTDAGGSIWVPTVVSTTYSTLAANPAKIVFAPLVSAVVSSRIGSMRHRKVESLI